MPSKTQLTGGAFQDVAGNALALGYLIMVLNKDSVATGVGNISSNIEITINLDASGNVITSPAQSVWGNNDLLPINSFYKVTAYSVKGQRSWGPNHQTVTSGTTFDIGTWVPNQVIFS